MKAEILLEVLFNILSAALYEVYMALSMDKDETSHNSTSSEAWVKLLDIVTMHKEFEA